jgi:hypothetical protein
MPVGFPTKTTYVDGDVFSASDINDTNGTINLLTSSTLSLAGGKNVIINGGMDIWQRGTSFTSFGALLYSADRWTASTSGTSINITATQQTTVPNTRSQFSQRFMQVSTGATSLVEYCARQFIEQSNVLPLHGKSAVLSFWYRSNKTGTHGARVFAGYNTGGGDNVFSFTVNAADTWEYKTIAVSAFSTVTANSASFNAAGAIVDLGFRVAGTGAGFTTVSANDYFQFTQVQLELGSAATSFSRAGGTIQGELAACQRYYFRMTPNNVFGNHGIGFAVSSSIAYCYVKLAQTMRVTPTSVDFNALAFNQAIGSVVAINNVTLDVTSPDTISVSVTTLSSWTTGNSGRLINNNNSAGFLGFNAEL